MEIKLIHTQKVLSPTQISLADYVINPYRGCEFNCLYCYGQFNKNIKETDVKQSLGVKINAVQCLEKELKYTRPSRVLLGSITECFQSHESRFKISGEILRLLNARNIAYTILTKSHLIKEYLPLISKNPENKIYFTLNCADDKIIRLLEEKSPGLKMRLETINEIIKNNIALRIHIGPFIPYVSCLKKILAVLPKGIEEIDIEIYHHKMGNFEEILNRIEKYLGEKVKENLQKTYLNETNYHEFADTLREKIKNLCLSSQYKFKVFYIVPDFNKFYTAAINYETTHLSPTR